MANHRFDPGMLRLFVEVAKCGSLTAAAQKLGLTQPAVSYQIRQLEDSIGAQLFNRQHRGVELTISGQMLFSVANKALHQLDDVVRDIRHQTASVVRIFTDYAFSSLWLLPRLHKFRQAYPAIDLQVIANQQLQAKQPAEGEIYILFGTERDFGSSKALLLPEKVAPVAAPKFAQPNGAMEQPQLLFDLPMLHLEAVTEPSWYNWERYFADQGLTLSGKRQSGDSQYNTYTMVLQAALAGAGVAIGWLGLIEDQIRRHELCIIGPQLTRMDRGYWLLADDAAPHANSKYLQDWILQEIKDDS